MHRPREYAHLGAFPLPKLIYILGLIIFVGYYVCAVVIQYLTKTSNVGSLVAALTYSDLALIGFPLVSGIIACIFYAPTRTVLSSVESRAERNTTWFSSLLYGFGGGLLAFILSIPFLLRHDAGSELVANEISHIFSISALAILLLIIVALPVVMEMTFRGIVFRTLVIHADVPSAVLASSLLFAFIWPTFGRPVGVILGVVSSLLFLRTNTLLASILANAVLSLSGGAFVVYRALARH